MEKPEFLLVLLKVTSMYATKHKCNKRFCSFSNYFCYKKHQKSEKYCWGTLIEYVFVVYAFLCVKV